MPRFSANLSMLFTEVDFLDRFKQAAKAGFEAVEFLFPYAWQPEQLADVLKRNGLTQVLHNLPAGKWEAGERGIAGLPDRKDEFKAGVERAIRYAKALGCPRLNCLAGIVPAGVSPEVFRETFVENLRFAAAALEKENIQLLVESLNSGDVPGFYLSRTTDALALLDEVDHPNLWLQYDIYHMQIMEGNLTQTIKTHLQRIAHMQLADVPGRHEPGTGEINFTNLFRSIDQVGYAGWIGCEYIPSRQTEETLEFIKNR
jgi:hydroxypyruvate isomerase